MGDRAVSLDLRSVYEKEADRVFAFLSRFGLQGADLEDASAPPNIAGLTLAGISIRAMEYLSDLVVAMRQS